MALVSRRISSYPRRLGGPDIATSLRRNLIFAALALAFTAATAQPAAATRSCRDVYYRYTENGTPQYVQASAIVTFGASCRTARAVARRYGATYRRRYGANRRILRYFCAWERIGSDVGIARCHRVGAERPRIRFAIYDSSPFH